MGIPGFLVRILGLVVCIAFPVVEAVTAGRRSFSILCLWLGRWGGLGLGLAPGFRRFRLRSSLCLCRSTGRL